MSRKPFGQTQASPPSEPSSNVEAEGGDDDLVTQAKTHVVDSPPAPRSTKLAEEEDGDLFDDSHVGDLLTQDPLSGSQRKQIHAFFEMIQVGRPCLPPSEPLDDNEKSPRPARDEVEEEDEGLFDDSHLGGGLTPDPSSEFQPKQKCDFSETTPVGRPCLPLSKSLDNNEKSLRDEVDSLDENAVVSINGEHPRGSHKDNLRDVHNDAGDLPPTRNTLVTPVPAPVPRNPREIVPAPENAKAPTCSEEEVQAETTKRIYPRTNYVQIIAEQISTGIVKPKYINLDTNPIIEHPGREDLKVDNKDLDRDGRDLNGLCSNKDSACANAETSPQQQLDENQENNETQQSRASLAAENASNPPAPSTHTNQAETRAAGGPSTDSQQGSAVPVPASRRPSSDDDDSQLSERRRRPIQVSSTQDSLALPSLSAASGDIFRQCQNGQVSLSCENQPFSKKPACGATHAFSAQTATISASPSESSGEPGAPGLQANRSDAGPRRHSLFLVGAEETGEASGDLRCPSRRSSIRSELAALEEEHERLSRVCRCPVCLNARVNRILCPCMHGLCSVCCRRLRRKPCPKCKDDIKCIYGVRWDSGESPIDNEVIMTYQGSSPVSEAPIPHTVDDQIMDQIPPALRTEDVGDGHACPRCFIVQACRQRGQERIPVHPSMGMIDDRIDNLTSGYPPGPARHLALAGLFEEDGVLQCFHCGSEVVCDESDDAPTLHGQLYPNCRHVRRQRLPPLPNSKILVRSRSFDETDRK